MVEAIDGEPWYGVEMSGMTRVCWKLSDYMGSSNDKRYRQLKPHLRNWYWNVSKIATKLLRGHWYQKHLIRESDGLSVRWGAFYHAVVRDRAFFEHPDGVPITSQRILAALEYGGHDHPRFLLAFQCDEYGWSKHDLYDKPGGMRHHVRPVWDGLDDCPDISERIGGVLYIKSVGGHIDWKALGRKDMVRACHADNYLPIYSSILRNLNFFPGPTIHHTAPQRVSDWLRDAHGDRAVLCGGPGRDNPGAKETGFASLNDPKIETQATTRDLDHECLWSTFPAYLYDQGKDATCFLKIDSYGLAHIDCARVWFSRAMLAVFSHDAPWNRILESVRLRGRELLRMNPDAQWDKLVEYRWMAKRIMVHGRPMNWEKGAYDASGLPIPREPTDEEPRKWVERGGTGTKEWLYDRRAEMPNFAPKSSITQGPATSSQAASSSGGGKRGGYTRRLLPSGRRP